MKRAPALQPVPSEPRIGLLLRLSKADDDTIEVQERNARRHAEAHFPDVPIDHVFADNGVTGDDWDKRSALGQAMQWLRPGYILIARDASRLGREIVESLNFIREICQRKQARLVYYQTGKETRADNPTDWVINAIEAFGAEVEHKKIIENTTAKQLEVVRDILTGKRRADRALNGGCYGYRTITDDNDEPISIVHEGEAAIVRRIYQWSRDGLGCRAIAARLNADGVPPPYADRKRDRKGNKWPANTIAGMLDNRRYKGIRVWGETATERKTGRKQKVVRAEPLLDIPVPSWRIIDDELWDAVHEGLVARRTNKDDKTGKGSRGRAAKYPLSSIAKCAACGASINVRSWPRKLANGRRYTQYTYGCSAHHYKGASVCRVNLRQDIREVEGALADWLVKTYLTDDCIEQLTVKVTTIMERRLGKPRADVDALQKEIATLRKRLDAISEAMLEVDDRKPFAKKHKETSTRLKEAERELADAWKAPKERHAAIASAAERVRNHCRSLRTDVQSTDRALKRQVFEAVFPGGLYFTPIPVPKGTPLPKRSGRRQIFRIEGSPDTGHAIVISGRNSFLNRTEMTTPTTRKDSHRMVVVALPRVA